MITLGATYFTNYSFQLRKITNSNFPEAVKEMIGELAAQNGNYNMEQGQGVKNTITEVQSQTINWTKKIYLQNMDGGQFGQFRKCLTKQ